MTLTFTISIVNYRGESHLQTDIRITHITSSSKKKSESILLTSYICFVITYLVNLNPVSLYD